MSSSSASKPLIRGDFAFDPLNSAFYSIETVSEDGAMHVMEIFHPQYRSACGILYCHRYAWDMIYP